MADIDFPTLIEQGVEAWNQWRLSHPDVRPDLSRTYLYGQTLNGFDLSHVNLERACLIGASLIGANLSGACLVSVYASKSNFAQANLTGADLRQGSFTEADFGEADLSAANVQGTEFAGANFTAACLAALRADPTTSFGGVQGQYVYVKLPPAGRLPQVGDFQSGELAVSLQQRFAPRAMQMPAQGPENSSAGVAVAAVSTLGSAEGAHQLSAWLSSIAQQSLVLGAAIKETSGLFLDWLIKVVGRLRQRLMVWVRGCYHFVLTELMPMIHRYEVVTGRWVRGFYLRSRRQYRRLSRRLGQQSWWLVRWLRWYRKRQWRRFSRSAVLTYQRTLRYFQEDFGPACNQLSTSVLRFCRYWRIIIGRSSGRSLARWSVKAQAEIFKLRLMWADFMRGDRTWQRQLAIGHQAFQREFDCASEHLQVVAFRQTERLYALGLVGEQSVKVVIAMAREQLQQSEYLQSVTADLRKEYRRYPLPLAVGFAGAIGLMLLNPVMRSERNEAGVGLPPIDASTVDEAVRMANGASATQPGRSVDVNVNNGLRDPESVEASMATSSDITLPARRSPEPSPVMLTQPATSGINSLDLPCPASSVDLSKTLPAYPYQDGSIYYGEVADGQPADGQGTMTYPTGNRYDGEYRNGRREGCGTFSFSDGRRYVGQFKADQFNGLGTWILENGERYIGEFENNKCDGQGSFIYANGTVKAGIWREGVLVDSALSCEWGSLRVPASSDN